MTDQNYPELKIRDHKLIGTENNEAYLLELEEPIIRGIT